MVFVQRILVRRSTGESTGARIASSGIRSGHADKDEELMESFLDLLRTFGAEILARPEGPFAFRFILQPLMSLLMATRDGIKDSRTGRTPYLWHIASTDPQSRRAALHDGLRSTGRILLLGVFIDAMYQYKAMEGLVRPLEALAVAFILGFLPYLLFRGPIARMARIVRRRRESAGQ